MRNAGFHRRRDDDGAGEGLAVRPRDLAGDDIGRGADLGGRRAPSDRGSQKGERHKACGHDRGSFHGVFLWLSKNSAMLGAAAAAPGNRVRPSGSAARRSVLSC